MTTCIERVLRSPNPLPSDIDWERVASTLGYSAVVVADPWQGQVVDSVAVGECEADLLSPERQEVDGFGERPDLRVGVVLEWDGTARGCLTVLDALKDEVAARLHEAPLSSVGGTSEGTARRESQDSAAPFGGPS